MKCKNCGADLAEGVKFCGQCGEPVEFNDGHKKIYQEDLKPGETKDPAQEEFEEIIEEVEDEEEFEEIIDDVERIADVEREEGFHAGERPYEGFKEEHQQKEEPLIAGPGFSDKSQKEAGQDGAIDEPKPSGVIKAIALGSMALMFIFALVYVLDLFRLVVYSIGGLF